MPSKHKAAHASPRKARGKSIYLSSRIDGAIEVLKKSKQKEEDGVKAKPEKELGPIKTPDPVQLKLQNLFEMEKKQKGHFGSRHGSLMNKESKTEHPLMHDVNSTEGPNSARGLKKDESFNEKAAGDYSAAPEIRITHFGLVNEQGEFLSTRCAAFNYNRHSHMKMASTFGARRSTNISNSPNAKGAMS